MSLIAGSFTIVLNKTTLNDVLKHFHDGKIFVKNLHGTDSIYSVCYRIRAVKNPEYVWFLSDGEMGMDTHVITEIEATRRILPRSEWSGCGKITKPIKLAFNNGIWIGGSARQIDKTLGAPSAKKRHWQAYMYLGGKVYTIDGKRIQFDVVNSFVVHIQNSTIVEIDASQTISD